MTNEFDDDQGKLKEGGRGWEPGEKIRGAKK